MKVTKPQESMMVVTIEHYAEIRFTPNGHKLATFHAKGMRPIIFQQWEDGADDINRLNKLSAYARESGEYEGTVDRLVDLPVNAEIIVVGRCELYRFKAPDGTQRTTNLFTVRDWSYPHWEWKLRNQQAGMATPGERLVDYGIA